MTILNEYWQAEVSIYELIFMIAVIAIVSFIFIYVTLDDRSVAAIILSAVLTFIFGALVFGLAMISGVTKKEHYIQATVDDDYSFVEIDKRYEIVEKSGEIYTFRVKEENKE